MIPANPFFKTAEKQQFNVMGNTNVNNDSARVSVGHPRFGFKVMLPTKVAPLPTAPAIVGGNVDWTKSRVTPASQYLHSVLSVGRPMSPAPQLGSFLSLAEPNINSIHTTY